MSLYDELKHIPHDNHYSDLYVLVTPESRQILSAHKCKCQQFVSQIDGRLYFDIPFAFQPYWEQRTRKERV